MPLSESHREFPLIVKPLLSWYDSHARILPWRSEPMPYRVWVSEMMLQQTRVDTVIPYFERFMAELPTLQSLAEVEEEQLLKLWEGLGYYSRARNLKKAANQMMDEFAGKLPMNLKDLQKLAGIGPYTAGAIASIAYGVKATAVDGNVLRVASRLTANHGDIARPKIKEELTRFIESQLPDERVGDFNQALMEMGAIVCLPNGAPKCVTCPLNSVCEAFAQGIVSQLPVKMKKAPKKIEQKTIFIIRQTKKDQEQMIQRVAIRKRSDTGLLAGLWELPNVPGHLTAVQCIAQLADWGIAAHHIAPLPKARHIFTHIEWHMIGYEIQADEIGQENIVLGFVWVLPEELAQRYSVPTAFRAYIEKL